MHRTIRILAAAALMAVAVPNASAAPCAADTFAGYLALGPTGCDVAGTVFADFSIPSVLPAGATPIDPNAVQVTPVSSPTDVGLLLTVNLAALAGEFIDTLFHFDVTAGSGGAFSGAAAQLSGASATGDGVTSMIEDLCLDGAFAPPVANCTGTHVTLLPIVIEGFDFSSDSLAFAANASFIDVVADIGVDGGLAGTAALAGATLRFTTAAPTAVPEPTTFALVALALLALGALQAARPSRARR